MKHLVMIIEDEEALALMLKYNLEKEGYNVSDRKIEDDSIVDMIYSICNTLSPRRYLGKEDMKELINDYIDTWIC